MSKNGHKSNGNSPQQASVYGLRAKGGDLFYIGSTVQTLKARLSRHFLGSHNKAVIVRLKQLGRENVEIVLIESVDESERLQREYEIISQHLAAGAVLLNTQLRVKASLPKGKPANSFDPIEGESMPAFQAFAEYRDMGDSRSLEAVARVLSKSSQLLKRWSARWSWVDRVKAYEAHMGAIEQRGREKALTRKAADWASRELEMAALLYDKAKAMLEFPLAKEVTKDGQMVVMPADWRMRDAAAIAEAAIKLERLARGESTENVTVNDKRRKLAEVLGIPLEEVPIDETERLAS